MNNTLTIPSGSCVTFGPRHSSSSYRLAILFLCAAMPIATFNADARSDDSKARLLAAAASTRQQLATLRFDTETILLGASPPGAVKYCRARSIISPGKFRSEVWSGDSADWGVDVWAAFDGSKFQSWRSRQPGTLLVNPAPSQINSALSCGPGVWDAIAWAPMHDAIGPRTGLDLVAALQSDESVVLPEAEMIDGILCTVVDVVSPETGTLVHRLWLDAANGAVPVRHQTFSSKSGDLLSERAATEFTAVLPGVALPISGTCTYFGVVEDGSLATDFVYSYSVLPLPEGGFFHLLPLPESTFDLAASLPQGVRVLDPALFDSKASSLLDRGAEAISAATMLASEDPPPTFEARAEGAGAGTWLAGTITRWSSWTAVCAALAGAGLALFLSVWSRRRGKDATLKLS